MDTLVTREILTNFTSLLNGQMSCNGLSIMVVNHFDQALWESGSLSSTMWWMFLASLDRWATHFHNNLLWKSISWAAYIYICWRWSDRPEKTSSAYNLGQCKIQFPGADKFTHFSHQHHFVHQGVQYRFVKAVSTFDYWNMDSSLQFWLPTGTKKLKQSATSNSSTWEGF